MAVIPSNALADMRRRFVEATATVDLTKTTLNAALQAVEDWFDANRNALNTAINNATAPVVLSPARKAWIIAVWLLSKGRREGA